MSKEFVSKMCAYKCSLEDLLEQYTALRPSERAAAAMLPLIECWEKLEAIGERMHRESGLLDEDLQEWLDGMHNADGSKGPHWTEAQTTAVGESVGISWDKLSPKCWHVAMNAMYSDYMPVAEKVKATGPEFYAELAKAFLMDKDGGGPQEKLAGYYHGVVKPASAK